MRDDPTKEAQSRRRNTKGIHDITAALLTRQDRIQEGLEYFWVAGLSHEDRLLFIELIRPGSPEEAADPMDVSALPCKSGRPRSSWCTTTRAEN